MTNKISQRRWINFKKNKKAFYSAIIFLLLFLVSLCAEFIANDKPLLIIFKGKYYTPVFNFYSEKEFGGDLRTEAIYKDVEVQCLIISSGNNNCWESPNKIIDRYNQLDNTSEFQKGKIFWAIIRYKHNTIADLDEPAPSPPSYEHFLGTDDTARDVMARIIYGFRISVIFGLLVTIAASSIGVLIGGIIGDKIGRYWIIMISVLWPLPFTIILPYADLFWTGVLTILINLIMASAFASILIYAIDLLPSRIGLIGGLFYGLNFGLGGIAAGFLGVLTEKYGIENTYLICSFMPFAGLMVWFLPRTDNKLK